MASPVLPPNPCLIGVVLVIKCRTGATTVFHYPPRPGEDDPALDAFETISNRDYDTDLPTTSSDESDSHSSSSGTPGRKKDAPRTRREHAHNRREQELADKKPDVDEEGSSSPDKVDTSGHEDGQRMGGHGLLFGSMGLTQLLAPARTFHKKKFEMTLDGLVYLGWPVFVREDGLWQKKKKARKQAVFSEASEDKVGLKALGIGNEDGRLMGNGGDDDGGLDSGVDAGTDDQADEDGQVDVPDPEAIPRPSDPNAGEEKDGMNNEPKKETASTTAPTTGLTMFNIVFLLNPPPLEYHLRVTEMYDHVVKKFSRALKWEQARSGYVWEQSQLILKLTQKASKNKTPPATLYPQILAASPLAKALSTLYRSISTSRIATLSLTPTTTLSLQIPLPSPSHPYQLPAPSPSLPYPPPHHALLLLSDPGPLLKSLTHSPLFHPLTTYLTASTPRKTFAQVSLTTHLPLPHILFLAAHLIHWRRAIPIPPLHHRDTYVVSPSAPLHSLPAASKQYAKRFSGALPGLGQMLALVGGAPRVWAALVPSKDHKAAYLEVLAWLVRGGWVERLRTGAWVRVPGWVVARAEAEAAEAEGGVADSLEAEGSDVGSDTSSTHTAVSPSPSRPQAPAPQLVLHPLRPSATTSHHLALISAHLLHTQGPESRDAWERCVKYFDGVHALEKMAVREGWKRGRVESWVEGWRAEGVLVGGRWV